MTQDTMHETGDGPPRICPQCDFTGRTRSYHCPECGASFFPNAGGRIGRDIEPEADDGA